jgi:hypothetical protein
MDEFNKFKNNVLTQLEAITKFLIDLDNVNTTININNKEVINDGD